MLVEDEVLGDLLEILGLALDLGEGILVIKPDKDTPFRLLLRCFVGSRPSTSLPLNRLLFI